MGKLNDLLKNLSGEVGTFTALGRWMRAVSLAIDDSVIGTSAQYIETRRTLAVQSFAAAGDVLLDATTLNSVPPIVYSGLTGIYTLEPNSRYSLEAFLRFENFGTQIDDNVTVEWVDGVTNTPLVAGHTAVFLPPDSTIDAAIKPGLKVLFITGAGPAALTVKLRVTQIQGTTATADLSVDSYAIVQELS